MTVGDSVWVRARRRSVTVVVGAAIVCYTAIASNTKPNTAHSVIAVALPVTVVGVSAFRRTYPEIVQTRRLHTTTMIWAALTLAGLLWEAGAYLGEHTVGQYQFPTLSVLAEPTLADPTVRFGTWLLWLLAGWRLVQR